MTFFFVPLLITFFTVLACKDVSSKQYIYEFDTIECWSGIHTFYAIASIICCFILSLLVIFKSYCYFDGVMQFSKSNSQKDGIAKVA